MKRVLVGCAVAAAAVLVGIGDGAAQVPGLSAPVSSQPGGPAGVAPPASVPAPGMAPMSPSGAVAGLPAVRDGAGPRLQADPYNTFGNSLLLEAEMDRELMKAKADAAEQRRRLRELESATKGPAGSGVGTGAGSGAPVPPPNLPVMRVQPSIVGVVSGDGGYRVMVRQPDGRMTLYGPGEKLPDGRVISQVTAQQVSFQRGAAMAVPNTGAVGR